jgi:hypothetical protein
VTLKTSGKRVTEGKMMIGKAKKVVKKKKKLVSMSLLEKKLDKIFSIYSRLKDADEGGTVTCVTCNVLKHWKDVDAGHFIKRQYRSVRWNDMNVHPQCFRCNHFMGGRQDDYANFIIKTYGQESFNLLMASKYQIVKHTRSDLEEMIEEYSQKVKGMEEKWNF